MRKRITNIIIVLVLLIGLSLLLYPTVSDLWNQHHQSQAITGYTETVDSMSTDDYDAMLNAAREYNLNLQYVTDRYHPTEEDHKLYLDTLDITGTGIMGYVEIPSIDVSLPIYHGADDTVLQVAVGHIEGTSLPVGGRGTHCVLSGHRGLPSARLFTDLDQMTEGDIFMLKVLDQTLTYQVDQIVIVLPEEVQNLGMTAGRDYCTLVTCTPYGVNTHRLLVRGERIDNLAEAEQLHVSADAQQIEPMLVAAGLAGPVLLVMLIGVMIPKRRSYD